MSDNAENFRPGQNVLPLESLPKPVLQQIYHAVTGKTENLSARLRGNVIINAADFERLYDMLIDQLNLYKTVVNPTTTILIKHEGGKSTTYSSWERFKTLSNSNYEVTSEITLRIEFLIHLPQTERPQRCIVSINLDSSLPFIMRNSDHAPELEDLGFAYFIAVDWTTIKISIDFVDFLIAKAFSGVVEEWFRTLEKSPSKKLDKLLLMNQSIIRRTLQQVGRLGMVAFLIVYVVQNSNDVLNLRRLILTGAVGLGIWVLASILEAPIAGKLFKRVVSNLVPSVILLTSADNREYDKVLKEHSSSSATLMGLVGTVISALVLNVIASYIYTFLTTK